MKILSTISIFLIIGLSASANDAQFLKMIINQSPTQNAKQSEHAEKMMSVLYRASYLKQFIIFFSKGKETEASLDEFGIFKLLKPVDSVISYIEKMKEMNLAESLNEFLPGNALKKEGTVPNTAFWEKWTSILKDQVRVIDQTKPVDYDLLTNDINNLEEEGKIINDEFFSKFKMKILSLVVDDLFEEFKSNIQIDECKDENNPFINFSKKFKDGANLDLENNLDFLNLVLLTADEINNDKYFKSSIPKTNELILLVNEAKNEFIAGINQQNKWDNLPKFDKVKLVYSVLGNINEGEDEEVIKEKKIKLRKTIGHYLKFLCLNENLLKDWRPYFIFEDLKEEDKDVLKKNQMTRAKVKLFVGVLDNHLEEITILLWNKITGENFYSEFDGSEMIETPPKLLTENHLTAITLLRGFGGGTYTEKIFFNDFKLKGKLFMRMTFMLKRVLLKKRQLTQMIENYSISLEENKQLIRSQQIKNLEFENKKKIEISFLSNEVKEKSMIVNLSVDTFFKDIDKAFVNIQNKTEYQEMLVLFKEEVSPEIDRFVLALNNKVLHGFEADLKSGVIVLQDSLVSKIVEEDGSEMHPVPTYILNSNNFPIVISVIPSVTDRQIYEPVLLPESKADIIHINHEDIVLRKNEYNRFFFLQNEKKFFNFRKNANFFINVYYKTTVGSIPLLLSIKGNLFTVDDLKKKLTNYILGHDSEEDEDEDDDEEDDEDEEEEKEKELDNLSENTEIDQNKTPVESQIKTPEKSKIKKPVKSKIKTQAKSKIKTPAKSKKETKPIEIPEIIIKPKQESKVKLENTFLKTIYPDCIPFINYKIVDDQTLISDKASKFDNLYFALGTLNIVKNHDNVSDKDKNYFGNLLTDPSRSKEKNFFLGVEGKGTIFLRGLYDKSQKVAEFFKLSVSEKLSIFEPEFELTDGSKKLDCNVIASALASNEKFEEKAPWRKLTKTFIGKFFNQEEFNKNKYQLITGTLCLDPSLILRSKGSEVNLKCPNFLLNRLII